MRLCTRACSGSQAVRGEFVWWRKRAQATEHVYIILNYRLDERLRPIFFFILSSSFFLNNKNNKFFYQNTVVAQWIDRQCWTHTVPLCATVHTRMEGRKVIGTCRSRYTGWRRKREKQSNREARTYFPEAHSFFKSDFFKRWIRARIFFSATFFISSFVIFVSFLIFGKKNPYEIEWLRWQSA